MSEQDDPLNLPDLAEDGTDMTAQHQGTETLGAVLGGQELERTSLELQPVFDVPVHIKAVLGRASMEVADLLQLHSGSLIELDRRVGEAIDIYVNNRLVARGELVVVDDRLGVTMTEIIKDGDSV